MSSLSDFDFLVPLKSILGSQKKKNNGNMGLIVGGINWYIIYSVKQALSKIYLGRIYIVDFFLINLFGLNGSSMLTLHFRFGNGERNGPIN